MKKKNSRSTYFIVILIFLFQINISCNSNVDSEFKEIKRERDSLRIVLAELDQKYVFDSIRLVTEPSKENLLIPGSEYNVKFYFIGYNKDSYFRNYDTLGEASRDSIFPEKGVFHFKTLLKPEENEFEGIISTNSNLGKNYEAVLYNPNLLEE